MKFYHKNDSLYSYAPDFLFGKTLTTPRGRGMTTNDFGEADFMSFNAPYRSDYPEDPKDFAQEVKQVKLEYPHIKILLVWKDEIVQNIGHDKLYEVMKLLVEDNVFTKKEIIAFTPNINSDVEYSYFTHAPNYLAPIHYFIPQVYFGKKEYFLQDDLYPDDDGRYFGTKPIFENRINIKKTKKIISSARKWNHYRGSYYEKLLTDYPDLINDNNIIRFYDYCANSTLPSKFGKRTYYDLFPHNEPSENLENELMQDREEMYYEPLVEDYLKSYFAVIHETCFPDFHRGKNQDKKYFNQYHMTEKTIIPLAAKCVIFTNSHSDFDKYLNEVGIETFSDLFTQDTTLEIINEINSWSYIQIKKFYKRKDVQSRINKNFKLWKNWLTLRYRDNKVLEVLNEFVH